MEDAVKDTIGLLIYSLSCTFGMFNLIVAEDIGIFNYLYVSLILFALGFGTLFGMTFYYHFENKKRETVRSDTIPPYNNKKYDESEPKRYKTY